MKQGAFLARLVLKVAAADHQLNSSNIKAVGYNKEDKTLEIEFHSGGTYKYKDAPKSLFHRIKRVKSPGKFFHKHIKKDNKYPYEKLEKEAGKIPDHIRKAMLSGDKEVLRRGQAAAVKSRARNRANAERQKYLNMGEELPAKIVYQPSDYKVQPELNLPSLPVPIISCRG